MSKSKQNKICDLCGDLICPNCGKIYPIMKWFICAKCYEPYKDKQEAWKKRIEEKKKARKEKEKFQGEFEIIFKNAGLFKQLVKILESLNDYVLFELKEETIECKLMDFQRIAIIEIILYKNDFISFKYNFSNQKIILDLDSIEKHIEYFNDDMSLTIKRDIGALDTFFTQRKHTIKHLDPYKELDDYDRPPTNNLEKINFSKSFDIDKIFFEILNFAKVSSEIISIKITSTEIIFYADRSDLNIVYSYKISSENIIPDNLKKEGFYESAYNLEFMGLLSHLSDLTKNINISIRKDYPIKIDMDLIGGHKVLYWIAPKVNEPDDDSEDN